MDIEQVREFCLSLPGATEDMPYGPDWLVFRIEGKIFLHINLEASVKCIAIKMDPERNEQLRQLHAGITAAYHLNKKHWSDISLEGCFSIPQIQRWILDSYHLVLGGLPKRIQSKYQQEEP